MGWPQCSPLEAPSRAIVGAARAAEEAYHKQAPWPGRDAPIDRFGEGLALYLPAQAA